MLKMLKLPWWRWLVIVIHLLFVVIANYWAFWLRFDGQIPAREMSILVQMLPWLLVIRGVMFVPFRFYRGLWRYTGIYDLRDLSLGVAVSTFMFYLLVHWGFGLHDYPRSVFVVDSMLLVFMLGGLRLARRIQREQRHSRRKKRVLVYGAGDAGEMIVRDMKKHVDYQPVGFIDDDIRKVGHRIHGVNVLGTRESLPMLVSRERPDEVLVAIPGADPAVVRAIVRALEPFKLPIKTLPNLRELLTGTVDMSQVRSLSIEDLLARAPVGLEAERVIQLIRGKRVLVTGAGGSIGSETVQADYRGRSAGAGALRTVREQPLYGDERSRTARRAAPQRDRRRDRRKTTEQRGEGPPAPHRLSRGGAQARAVDGAERLRGGEEQHRRVAPRRAGGRVRTGSSTSS